MDFIYVLPSKSSFAPLLFDRISS